MEISKPCTLICENTARNPSISMEGLGLYYVRYLPSVGLKIKVNVPDKGNIKYNGLRIIERKPLIIYPIKCTLPKPEKPPMPDVNYKVSFKDQFSPMSVNHTAGVMHFNKKFQSMPYHFQVFIALHEMAHRFYKTEWKCDLWALVRFTELGYNGSNAYYSLSRILHRSRENQERLKRIFNNIPKQSKK